jgi:hypothetical protein
VTCRLLVAGLAVALLLVAPALADEDGVSLLERSAEATRTSTYAGEALWVVFSDARPYVTTVAVEADGTGEIDVEVPERLRGDAEDAGARSRAGWAMALPAIFEDAGHRLKVLTRNYELAVEGTEQVIGRPCTVLALHRQADGTLRERLWIDGASDLLLRRETYGADGELLRLGAFLSLDFDPDVDRRDDRRRQQRPEGVMPVDEEEVEALRKGGWTVPKALPRGYEAAAAYAMAGADTQPLQVVYGDGLYTVSVFQQPGSADWESLPAGARLAEDLPGEVYEWPGALPHRLVWTAEGRTWSVVGDAPADDLEAIAAALPTAQAPGVLERLQRGFSRLWSGVSHWGRTLVTRGQ